VLSGRINPSGHLPVSVPRSLGVLPYSYLHAKLGEPNGVSSIDTTPQYSFGHGLSYTTFELRDFAVTSPDAIPTDGGWIEVHTTVANTGSRDGTHLLQVYAHDPVAQVARPVRQLLGFTRVDVPAGQSVAVTMRIPVTRLAYSDRDLVRQVEPGDVEVWLGWDVDHPATEVVTVRLTGASTPVTPESPRLCQVSLD
jgi:beta-glucosidase